MKFFDIGLEKTPLTKVKDLPKKEFITLKSSHNCINNLFGEGWLEGSVVHMSGSPGCGKTTFWIQLLEDFSKNYSCAYISNEESQDQLQKKCQRLNVENVEIAYMSSLEDVLEIMKSYQIVVIDSFQGIVSPYQEKETISKIVAQAKMYNCCIALIVHMTKTKIAKGGSEVAHLCDQVIRMVPGVSEYFCLDDKCVIINSDKNRNGKSGYLVLENGSSGYNFELPWDDELVEELDPKAFKKV